MTRDEFVRQYDAYPWDPYHPLAVILAGGERAYIDRPEQVTLTPDELVLTRRQNPTRPERYRYADVARLVPLPDLPADPGGISYAEFDGLIRRLILQKPFQPFVIELRAGDRVEVRRPGPRAGRFLTVVSEPPLSVAKIDFDQIARITLKADAVPA